jgi:hypothetical protein
MDCVERTGFAQPPKDDRGGYTGIDMEEGPLKRVHLVRLNHSIMSRQVTVKGNGKKITGVKVEMEEKHGLGP